LGRKHFEFAQATIGLRVRSEKFGLRELCLGGLILRRRGEDVKEITSAGGVDYF
jgi:hypothetical protein